MINLNSENKEPLLDVVNKNDVVIESRSKNDVHHLGLLHREVHVWLFDKDRNIFFSKSAAHRSSAGLLDAPVGGHVDKEEDYITAAIRETKEESGLSVLESDLIFLTQFRGTSEHKKIGTINNFIRSVYIYKNPVTDEEIKADPDETDGFHKFSLAFLSKLSEKDRKLFHLFVPTHELPSVLDYLKSKHFK